MELATRSPRPYLLQAENKMPEQSGTDAARGRSDGLRYVTWKLHSYKGVWKPPHLTRDGRRALCGVRVPRAPWAKRDGVTKPSKRPCKNCESILTREVTQIAEGPASW